MTNILEMIVLVFYIQLVLLCYLGYLFLHGKQNPMIGSNLMITPGKNISVKTEGNKITIDSTVDTYNELKNIMIKSSDVDLKCDDDNKQISLEVCAMEKLENDLQNMFIGGDHIKVSKSKSGLVIDQLPLTDQEFQTHLEKTIVPGDNMECIHEHGKMKISVPNSKIMSQFVPGENIKIDKTHEDKIKISGILPIIDIKTGLTKEQLFNFFKPGENIDLKMTGEGIVISSPSQTIKTIINNYVKPGKSINITNDSDHMYISSAITMDDVQKLFVAGENIVISNKNEKLVISNTFSNAAIFDKIKEILRAGENILITPQDAKLVISNTQKDAKSQLKNWLVAGDHIAISPKEDQVLISVDKNKVYNTIKNMLKSSDNSMMITSNDHDMTLDFQTTYKMNDEIFINKIVQFMMGSEDVMVSKMDNKINLKLAVPKLMSTISQNLTAGPGISLNSMDGKIKISGSTMSDEMLAMALQKCLVGSNGITIEKTPNNMIQIKGADANQMLTNLQNIMVPGENIMFNVENGKLKISSQYNFGSMITSDSNIKINVSKDQIKFDLDMDAINKTISFGILEKVKDKMKNAFSSNYFLSGMDANNDLLIGINTGAFNEMIQNYLTMNNIYPINTSAGLTIDTTDKKASLGLDNHVITNIVASYLHDKNITGVVAGSGVIANKNDNTTTFSLDNAAITTLFQSYLHANNIKAISIGAGLSSNTSNNVTTVSLDLYNQLKTVLSRGNLVNVVFKEKSKKVAFRYDLLSNDLNIGNTIDALT